MKKLLLLLFTCVIYFSANAQTTVGPVEQKMIDTLCDGLNKLDQSKINTSKEATDAFMNCFMEQSGMFVDLAAEKNISMEDQQAMHELGVEIGKKLLKQKCEGFLKLAVKMAKKEDDDAPATSETQGTFKRIDTKGFNYFVIADNNGNEKTFLWLREFPESGKFTGSMAAYTGKKISIKWQEMEVYLPQAKGYYKVKEITGIELL
jgi:hypothetical protein